MAFCDGARRIPSKFRVTMAGATNGSCGSCSSLNADYLPEQTGGGCTDFTVAIGGSPCGFSEAAVVLSDSSGVFQVTFELRKSGGVKAVYVATDVIDLLAGEITLAFSSGPGDCNWPSSVSLIAVSNNISELATSAYISPPDVPFIPPYMGNMPVPGEFPINRGPSSISPQERIR